MKGELVRILIPNRNSSQSTFNSSMNFSRKQDLDLLSNLKWSIAVVFLLMVCMAITGLFLRYDHQLQLTEIKSEILTYGDRIHSLERQMEQLTMQNQLAISKEKGTVSESDFINQKPKNLRQKRSSNPGPTFSNSERRYVQKTIQTKTYRNPDYEMGSDESDPETDIIPDRGAFNTCGDDCGSNQATYQRTFQSQGGGSRYQSGGSSNSITVTFPPIKVHQEQHFVSTRQQSGSHTQSRNVGYDSGENLDLGSARRNRNHEPDIARILQIPSGTLRSSGFVLRGGNDGGPCNVTTLPDPCANAIGGVSGYNYTYVKEYSEGIPGARNYSEEVYSPSRPRPTQHTTSTSYHRPSVYDETRRQEEIQRQQRQRQEEITRQEQIRQDDILRLEEVRRQEQLREQQQRQEQLQREAEIRRQQEITRLQEETRRQEQLRQIEIEREEEIRRQSQRRPVYTERPTQATTQVDYQSHYRQSHREYHVRQGYETQTTRYYEQPRATSCRGPNPVAAHYVAETSSRTVNQIFKAWTAADWMTGVFEEDHRYSFVLSSTGSLAVRKSGLYYIYAQIYFEEESHLTGFTIEVNSEPFVQCSHLNEVYAGQQGGSKSNSCFTAGVRFINADDQIVIKDNSGRAYSSFDPDKSYFGLMNVGGTCQ